MYHQLSQPFTINANLTQIKIFSSPQRQFIQNKQYNPPISSQQQLQYYQKNQQNMLQFNHTQQLLPQQQQLHILQQQQVRSQTLEKCQSNQATNKSQPQSNQSKQLTKIQGKSQQDNIQAFKKKNNQLKRQDSHKLIDQYVTQIPRVNPHEADVHLNKLPYKCQETYYISDLLSALEDEQDQKHFSSIFKEHLAIQFHYIPIIQNFNFDEEEVIMRKLDIPKQEKKYNKTIIFDLDETLVHCTEEDNQRGDIELPITFPTGETVIAHINIRQYAKEIISKLADVCEVMIFTASHECYANKVIDYLDPDNKVSYRIFRDSCITVGDNYSIKNIDVIGRDLKNTVIVDNASYSFAHHLDNGIPIVSFYDDNKDVQLVKLRRFIQNHILPAEDVRPVIRNIFKLHRIKEFEDVQSAVEALYCQQQ